MAVLIADDDIATVKLLTFQLGTSGYQVLTANDGPSTIRMVEVHKPELVILDLALSHLNGIEVCQTIRRLSDVPVIFLSARSQLEDRIKGFQAGADDYISKPCDPQELLARIQAVLRRYHGTNKVSTAEFVRGPLRLDTVAHTVRWGNDKPRTLTPMEFRLLYFFMQHPGRVLTKRSILSQVWGYDDPDGLNLVSVYIARLRSKIERDVAHPEYIMTLPRQGYTFAIHDIGEQRTSTVSHS